MCVDPSRTGALYPEVVGGDINEARHEQMRGFMQCAAAQPVSGLLVGVGVVGGDLRAKI